MVGFNMSGCRGGEFIEGEHLICDDGENMNLFTPGGPEHSSQSASILCLGVPCGIEDGDEFNCHGDNLVSCCWQNVSSEKNHNRRGIANFSKLIKLVLHDDLVGPMSNELCIR